MSPAAKGSGRNNGIIDEILETRKRLEPDMHLYMDEDPLLASIAISLKRIADSLERSEGHILDVAQATWSAR